MDALLLARIKFAVTIGFHFIFPPISIGLAWLVVAAEIGLSLALFALIYLALFALWLFLMFKKAKLVPAPETPTAA